VGGQRGDRLGGSPERRAAAQRRASRRWARLSLERLVSRLAPEGAVLGGPGRGLAREEVVGRLEAVDPAVEALVLGRRPSGVQRLRRNVALHAASCRSPFATAGVADLRRAQRGPRLDGTSGPGRGEREQQQPQLQQQQQHESEDVDEFYGASVLRAEAAPFVLPCRSPGGDDRPASCAEFGAARGVEGDEVGLVQAMNRTIAFLLAFRGRDVIGKVAGSAVFEDVRVGTGGLVEDGRLPAGSDGEGSECTVEVNGAGLFGEDADCQGGAGAGSVAWQDEDGGLCLSTLRRKLRRSLARAVCEGVCAEAEDAAACALEEHELTLRPTDLHFVVEWAMGEARSFLQRFGMVEDADMVG